MPPAWSVEALLRAQLDATRNELNAALARERTSKLSLSLMLYPSTIADVIPTALSLLARLVWAVRRLLGRTSRQLGDEEEVAVLCVRLRALELEEEEEGDEEE